MTTPLNTSPAAVAHHDAVISAFNNYKYSRDSKDPSDAPFLLSLAAKYCMHVSFISYLFLCFWGKLIFEPGESHWHEGSCPTHASTDAQCSFPRPEWVQHPYQSNTRHGHSLWLPSCHQLLPWSPSCTRCILNNSSTYHCSRQSPCRYCRGNGRSESQGTFISYSYIFLTLLTQCGYILKQCPQKIVRSKAIVEDKDDKVEIIVSPVDIDYTMGGCDGPNAASGADTVCFLTNFSYRFLF